MAFEISKELERIVRADGGKVARQLAETLVDMALKGDIRAGRLLLDRLETLFSLTHQVQ